MLAVSKRNLSRVRFYTLGAANDWDVAISPLRSLAYKLAGRNIDVEIMIKKSTLNALDLNDRLSLASLCDHPQINLRELDFEPRAGQGWVLAEAVGGSPIRWAVSDQNALLFGPEWSVNIDFLIRGENSQSFSPTGENLASAEIRPNLNELGDKEFEITTELNGPLQIFGTRFWDFIATRYAAANHLLNDENDSLVSVSYNDRYVHSPINVALFFQVVKGLKTRLGDERPSSLSVQLTTTEKDNNNQYNNYQNKIWDDWLDSADRDRIAQLIFEQADIDFEIKVGSKSQVGHGRIMELKFSSGKKLVIRFDQGVSFWKQDWAPSSEMISYNFRASEILQRDRLCNLNIDIKGSDSKTQIFLKVRS